MPLYTISHATACVEGPRFSKSHLTPSPAPRPVWKVKDFSKSYLTPSPAPWPVWIVQDFLSPTVHRHPCHGLCVDRPRLSKSDPTPSPAPGPLCRVQDFLSPTQHRHPRHGLPAIHIRMVFTKSHSHTYTVTRATAILTELVGFTPCSHLESNTVRRATKVLID